MPKARYAFLMFFDSSKRTLKTISRELSTTKYHIYQYLRLDNNSFIITFFTIAIHTGTLVCYSFYLIHKLLDCMM